MKKIFCLSYLLFFFLIPNATPTPEIPGLLQYELQYLEGLPQEVGQSFQLQVNLGGASYSLDLRPHSLRAADFRLLVQEADGKLRATQAPSPSTYKGSVVGIPGSRVRASLGANGLSAKIVLEKDEVWHIQPSSDFGPKTQTHLVYNNRDAFADREYFCGTDQLSQIIEKEGSSGGGGMAAAATGNKVCDIAADADVEFYQKNGSSVPNTVHDIEDILNRVEDIYDVETDIVYEVTTIVVRTAEPDPYSSTSPDTLLTQVKTEWNTNPNLGSDVRRDIAQLFTGKELVGSVIGIAWLGTVCASTTSGQGYSVVQSRFTTVKSTRTCLSSHEIGHNWNAQHCDSKADCGIMCSGIGGCSGSCNTFGATETSQILAFKASRTCLQDEQTSLAVPFFEDFSSPALDLARWSYIDGASISSAAIAEPSPVNSVQLNATGSETYQDDELRSNFILLGGQSSIWLTYATEHFGVESGEQLTVEYWNNNLTWVALNTITSDGVDQTGFSFHTHFLPAAALHNEFRVRFRTAVNETNDNWYVDNVGVGKVRSITINSSPQPATIFTIPVDVVGKTGGATTPYIRSYLDGSLVTLAAPAKVGRLSFVQWKLNGIPQGSSTTLQLTADADKTALAEYSLVMEQTNASAKVSPTEPPQKVPPP